MAKRVMLLAGLAMGVACQGDPIAPTPTFAGVYDLKTINNTTLSVQYPNDPALSYRVWIRQGSLAIERIDTTYTLVLERVEVDRATNDSSVVIETVAGKWQATGTLLTLTTTNQPSIVAEWKAGTITLSRTVAPGTSWVFSFDKRE